MSTEKPPAAEQVTDQATPISPDHGTRSIRATARASHEPTSATVLGKGNPHPLMVSAKILLIDVKNAARSSTRAIGTPATNAVPNSMRVRGPTTSSRTPTKH